MRRAPNLCDAGDGVRPVGAPNPARHTPAALPRTAGNQHTPPSTCAGRQTCATPGTGCDRSAHVLGGVC